MDWFVFSWPTLLLIAIGLRMALKLNDGTRGPDVSDPVHEFLSITSWVLIWVGLIPAILLGVFSFVGLVIVLLAAATLVEVVVQRRAAQRRSVCSLLALYVERKRQIASTTLLSANTLRGRAGRAAKALFSSLNAGVPLAQAVQDNPRALPREAVAYLAATATRRTESKALRELSSGDGGELTALWRSCADRISYLGCVLLVTLIVFTFLMIKILPAYVDIFREFDMDLPPITQLAVATSNFFVHYLAIPVFLVFLVVVVCGFVIGVCYLCDIYVLRAWGDRFSRSRRNADVLRILAIAAEQQQPLASALDRVAHAYPSRTIRRQLLPAAAAVNSGGVWQDALCANRVVSTAEASLLKSAEQTRSVPWALRQVAARREKRAVYRLASALQVLYPVAIVLVGAMIGFYVISLFIPLVRLIQGLAV